MTTLELEEKIRRIEQRNKKVEADKAWEGSFVRKVLIALFTYIALGSYMWAIGAEPFYLHAIVPTVGFLLSTLTLPYFKKIWIGKKVS